MPTKSALRPGRTMPGSGPTASSLRAITSAHQRRGGAPTTRGGVVGRTKDRAAYGITPKELARATREAVPKFLTTTEVAPVPQAQSARVSRVLTCVYSGGAERVH